MKVRKSEMNTSTFHFWMYIWPLIWIENIASWNQLCQAEQKKRKKNALHQIAIYASREHHKARYLQ